MIKNNDVNRRQFLRRSMFAMAAFSLSSQGKTREHSQGLPNIIYINVDDLGWTDLGFQGSDYYETPNIDKLASEGMVFTNAYAPAANCAPSRACCFTGQYTPRHGVYTVSNSDRGKSKDRKLIPIKNTLHIKEENLTIAHVLQSAGYKTCTIGKWHISNDPLKNGFDVNIAGSDWGHPGKGYFRPFGMPGIEKGPDGEYLTDRLTDEAVKFVTENKDRPFFLYLPYYTVHNPIQAKPDKEALFTEKKSTPAHNNAAYAAMISSLDDGVGRVLATLENLDLAKNALILFTSDNGGVWKTSKQWPLRAGKGSYYEGGIREPMIVRWPGVVKPGSRCDAPVSGIDFFPTFVKAAGAKVPADKILDGVSLLPLLKQTGRIKDRALFWHFPIYLQGYPNPGRFETRDRLFRTRPGSVIRYGDWKLHEYFEDGGLELYNLAEDIGEKNDLAATHPAKVKELHGMLKKWREKTDAPAPRELNLEYKARN
jgi:arylsulfatase A-like enzyme